MSLAAVALRSKRRKQRDSLGEQIITPHGVVRFASGREFELRSREEFYAVQRRKHMLQELQQEQERDKVRAYSTIMH